MSMDLISRPNYYNRMERLLGKGGRRWKDCRKSGFPAFGKNWIRCQDWPTLQHGDRLRGNKRRRSRVCPGCVPYYGRKDFRTRIRQLNAYQGQLSQVCYIHDALYGFIQMERHHSHSAGGVPEERIREVKNDKLETKGAVCQASSNFLLTLRPK